MNNRLGHSVVLHTGIVKHLHDLEIGDLVMSDNSYPNRVLQVRFVSKELLEISLKGKERKPFYIDKDSKIRLKKYDIGMKKFRTVEVSIEIFKYLSQAKQNDYFLFFRKGWNLPATTLRISPYELGRKILSNPIMTIEFLSPEQKKYLKKFYHSDGYSIPNDYLYAKIDEKRLFLAGILDSYAHINTNGQSLHVNKKTNEHLRYIEILCCSLGFETKLNRNGLEVTGCFNEIPMLKHQMKKKEEGENYYRFNVVSVGINRYKQVFFQNKGHHLLSNGIVMNSNIVTTQVI